MSLNIGISGNRSIGTYNWSLLNCFDKLAPTALALTVIDDTQIKLDWTNNSVNADGVSIERSIDGITYNEIATVAANVATYTDATGADGRRQYYRLKAYRNTTYSAPSTAANDWCAIKLVLTSTGTGAGVSTIRLQFAADVVATLSGAGRWYSDAEGTANESTSFTFVGAELITRYLKVTSGTSNLLLFAKGNWQKWGDNSANGWDSGTNAANVAKDISALTSLTDLFVTGSNTLSGSVAALTSLIYLHVTGSNTLSGSVAALTSLIYLGVRGSNTLTGSVAALTSLTYLFVTGSNTLSGSVSALTSLTFLHVSGSNTLTFQNVTNITGLCYLYVHTSVTLTSANVNQILADFWANRNAVKPRPDRIIDIRGSVTSGAPTGQGVIDATALAAYRSPNGDSTKALWTVITR